MIVVTLVLLIASLAHLFLFVYNRYLLCIADGPWKKPIHMAWLGISFVLPVFLLAVLSGTAPVRNLLGWSPASRFEEILFGIAAALIAFFGARTILWLGARAYPETSNNLLEETISIPVMPAVGSRLPRGFRRFETTGDLHLVEREIAVAGLAPAFDGIRIVQVSDVHFGRRLEMENYLSGVQELVAQLSPDVVVFTGDFVDLKRDIPRSVEYHAGFRGRLATLAVLGNHDYWTSAERLREELARTHIIDLGGGERRSLKRTGRRLTFVGTDAPWNGRRPDWKRLVRRETGDAVVLLSHTPDNAPLAARHGASLILSGHNHGGQMCLPLIGPFVVPSRHGLKYAGGCYRVGVESVLNVSRGVGVSSGGIRVLCPPEVCVLTLRAPVVEVMAGRVIPARAVLRPAQTGDAPGGIMARAPGASGGVGKL